MSKEKSHFFRNLLIVSTLLSVLYIVKMYEVITGHDLGYFGIYPKNIYGLRGILFAPFIHGSWEHLFSNTVPFFVLMNILLNAYDYAAVRVLVFIHIITGLFVWALAPSGSFHIGISGIIYGIVGFIILTGFFRNERSSFVIAILVGLMYGSFIWGFLPQPGVSWQSHLFGFVSGGIIAWFLRNYKLPPAEVRDDEGPEFEHFFDEVEYLKEQQKKKLQE